MKSDPRGCVRKEPKTRKNVADLGTKPFGKTVLTKHCLALGMRHHGRMGWREQGVAMFWDFGLLQELVTDVRAVSTQNAAGDRVKESSHRFSSIIGDEQFSPTQFGLQLVVLDGMANSTAALHTTQWESLSGALLGNASRVQHRTSLTWRMSGCYTSIHFHRVIPSFMDQFS